jgi:hypothetical protein
MIRRLLMLVVALLSSNAMAQITVSETEGIQIVITSQVTPIPLNQMHSWVIRLNSDTGEAIENANIRVEGGMPAHNHGLATRPQATDYLGEGEYLVEGLRFHMAGDWLMDIQIEHNGRNYRANAMFRL